MTDRDLSTLQVPRHVHKADGVSTIVQTTAELERAIAEGWQLLPPPVAPALDDEAAVVASSRDSDAAARHDEALLDEVDDAREDAARAPIAPAKKTRKR